MEANLQKQKERDKKNLDDLWYDEHNPRETLRDLEERLRKDSICVNRLEKIDRELWKKIEKILQQIFKDKLLLNY